MYRHRVKSYALFISLHLYLEGTRTRTCLTLPYLNLILSSHTSRQWQRLIQFSAPMNIHFEVSLYQARNKNIYLISSHVIMLKIIYWLPFFQAVMKIDLPSLDPMEGVGTVDLEDTYFDTLAGEVKDSLLGPTQNILIDIERLTGLTEFAKITLQDDPVTTLFQETDNMDIWRCPHPNTCMQFKQSPIYRFFMYYTDTDIYTHSFISSSFLFLKVSLSSC